MKKKRWLVLLISIAVMLSGCGETTENIISNKDEKTQENTNSVSTDEAEESVSETTVSEESSDSNEEQDIVETDGDAVTEINFDKKVTEDSFENALKFIKKQGTTELSVNYGQNGFKPGTRNKNLKSEEDYQLIDQKIEAYSMKKIRMLREDNNGSTIDFTVYTNPGTKMIDKITSTEYCSDGRDVTNFYFTEGVLSYVYAYKDDIYGTSYVTDNLPGKKCYFAKNTMTECLINDADVNFKNTSYTLADYSSYDDFVKAQYDELEKDLINRAYTTYAAVKDVPGTATISGYVADEYGGILSNVKMKISSKAHEYSEEFTTNGDGYYEIQVPVNEDDWYGVEYKYGDFNDVTIDDISIPSGTVTYSLGITYMAAPGENKHDTAFYLLNKTKSAPKRLKSDEYMVVLTFDNAKANLSPYMMNLKKEKSDTSVSTVITVDSDSQYKYFVTDQRGGHSDNTMTYEMSTSEAQVQVYGKDGLVASYQVPVNHAGVVWEVFEIKNGQIQPIDNYYYAVGKEIFFQ